MRGNNPNASFIDAMRVLQADDIENTEEKEKQ